MKLHQCQSEQACLERLVRVWRILNRQIRKVIYHWGGKPLTGRLAVALILSGNTTQLNGQVNGMAKAHTGSVICRDVGGWVWQITWNGKARYETEIL
jgi:hypothetical protein